MKLFCTNCREERETHTEEKEETYHVCHDKRPITVNATVRICNVCGCEIWDGKLDDDTLIKAYEKYEKLTGITVGGLKRWRERQNRGEKTCTD